MKKAKKVVSCCGKYFAFADYNATAVCPSCGKQLIAPVKVPIIYIV